MLCVWWNFDDILNFELFPNGRSIDSNLYYQQLEPIHAVLKLEYPALVNRRRVLLQDDNAPAHTSRLTKN